jgi:hypothetical protein
MSARRSTSTFAASSRGYDRLSPTPSTSAHRSTSTFAASSRGYDHLSPTPSTSARRSISTLAASSRSSARFADFVYIGSPLYTDMALYIDTFGGFCVC